MISCFLSEFVLKNWVYPYIHLQTVVIYDMAKTCCVCLCVRNVDWFTEILDFCDFISPTAEEEVARDAAVQRVFEVIKYIWPHCDVIFWPFYCIDFLFLPSFILLQSQNFRSFVGRSLRFFQDWSLFANKWCWCRYTARCLFFFLVLCFMQESFSVAFILSWSPGILISCERKCSKDSFFPVWFLIYAALFSLLKFQWWKMFYSSAQIYCFSCRIKWFFSITDTAVGVLVLRMLTVPYVM